MQMTQVSDPLVLAVCGQSAFLPLNLAKPPVQSKKV